MPSVRRSVRIPAFLLFVNTFFSFFAVFFSAVKPDPDHWYSNPMRMHQICHPYTCLRSFFPAGAKQGCRSRRAGCPILAGPSIHRSREKASGKRNQPPPGPAEAEEVRRACAPLKRIRTGPGQRAEPASRLSRATIREHPEGDDDRLHPLEGALGSRSPLPS